MKTVKETYCELTCDGVLIGRCKTEQLARKLANEKELIQDLCEYNTHSIDLVILERNEDVKEFIEKEIFDEVVAKLSAREWEIVQNRLSDH